MNMEYFTNKKKIINNIMINGKKTTSEKLFLKSLKELQINSTKQTKKILQLYLINSTPVFKLEESFNKRVKKSKRKVRLTPIFINKIQNRTSLGIKFFISYLRKIKDKKYFYKKLMDEILLIAENIGSIPEIKKENQKKVIANKRYIKHYRW